MNDRFDLGEIAIVVRCCDWPEYIGQDCTVTGPLCQRLGVRRDGSSIAVIGYEVLMADGISLFAPPAALKKKPPPPIFDAWEFLEEITDGWNPTKVKA
jgi:hypothetical protein